MATTGQTINDRINAARYALAGQGLARCVCKATTEEVLGPKKKHIDYLIACTNEPNVSIPQLANLLIERSNHTSWVVVFKSLITVHQLMSNGNEKFSQYMASSNYTFDLTGFVDTTVARGYNMSQFVRKYSQYINAKSLAYRTLALDLCKMGKDPNSPNLLRVINMENLSKTLPVLENQLDALLSFDCTTKDLSNNVINSAFMLLFRDLVKIFVSYNDCIINLLERYFKLSRKKTKEAFGLYKNFLERMDKIGEFLKIAEAIGVDKGEIPDLKRAPSSILNALQSHLDSLQPKKRSNKDTSHSPVSDAEEPKEPKEESNEGTPTNQPADESSGGNPFLSNTKEVSSKTEEKKIEDREEKVDKTSKKSEGGFAQTFGRNEQDEVGEEPDASHIADPRPNGKHQPPRPASSPVASPNHKAPAGVSSNDIASKPPSRPPSRPPPPSSASSSRAVSPTIVVDVAAEMAERQNIQEGEKNHEEIPEQMKASSKKPSHVDQISDRNDNENKTKTDEDNESNQIRRDSAISHTGHAPPARPAPPTSRKQSEAKIDPLPGP